MCPLPQEALCAGGGTALRKTSVGPQLVGGYTPHRNVYKQEREDRADAKEFPSLHKDRMDAWLMAIHLCKKTQETTEKDLEKK